ncbi:MAG TPA: hypothetical protein VMO47_15490 [Rhodothermales bacterium]|nr:hypothetical protein [Rhodothermales bacterium]
MQSSTFYQTGLFLLSGDEDWEDEVFEDDFEADSEDVFEDEWGGEETDEEWEDSDDQWNT